jgi:hypothetical protein
LALQTTGKQIEASVGWLTGWTYRKSHVINGAYGAGTNYQVRIVAHYGSGTDNNSDVYLNSHCRTDFGDVRFTDDDGSTLLDCWMESKVDSDNAVFWVEVADDLSTVAATIYVYYGKADATTTSNGDNTFLFFDDFNDNSFNTAKWDLISGSMLEQNQRLEAQTTGAWDEVDSDNTFSGIAMKISARAIQEVDYWNFVFRHYNQEGIDHGRVPTGKGWVPEHLGVDSTWDTTPPTLVLNQWYKLEIRLVGTKVWWLIDGVQYKYASDAVSAARKMQLISSAKGQFDDAYIRKFVDPEPNHDVWGSEEVQNNSPYAPTLSSPAAGYRFNPSSSVTFSWTFSDPNAGDYQTTYQFQLDNDSDFSSPIIDSNKVSSASQQTIQTLPSTVGLYYWRVKTWDSKDADGPYCTGRAIIVDRIKITACGILNNVVDTRTGGAVWYTAVYESDSTPFTGSNGTVYLNGTVMTWEDNCWTYAFPYSMSGGRTVFHITGVVESFYGLTGVYNFAGDIVLNWATMEITIGKP